MLVFDFIQTVPLFDLHHELVLVDVSTWFATNNREMGVPTLIIKKE